MQVIKNDYGYALEFEILNTRDNTPFDLTGCTIKFICDNGLDATANIADAKAGECFYIVQDGDFNTTGSYEAQIKVTSGTKQMSTVIFGLEVLDELAG
jgi:hypothetical protein